MVVGSVWIQPIKDKKKKQLLISNNLSVQLNIYQYIHR